MHTRAAISVRVPVVGLKSPKGSKCGSKDEEIEDVATHVCKGMNV